MAAMVGKAQAFLDSYGLNHWKGFEANALGRRWEVVEEGKYVQETGNKGPLYVNDNADWTCKKNIGAIAIVPLVLGLRAIHHISHVTVGIRQAVATKDYQAVQGNGFKALKFAMIAGAFYIDPQIYGLGLFGFGTMSMAFIGYAFYDPFGFKVRFTEIERKLSCDVPPKTDDEVAKMSVKAWYKSLADGSYSFSHLLKMVGHPTLSATASEGDRSKDE